MPGVTITTATRQGPVAPASDQAARYFVLGLTERGDATVPVRVRSLGEYEALLGQRVAYGALHDDLRVFFEEGGAEAFVARVVGPAASAGTLQLMDRATPAVATLSVTAASPGAWSTGMTVAVEAGTAAGTFRLVISYGGRVVERYDNIATPAAAVTRTAASTWITVADLGSVTAAPDNLPAVLAATALSAGTDDRANVDAPEVVAAAARFAPELGAGIVAAPGYTADLVGPGLIEHARTHNRLVALAMDVDAVESEATAAAATLGALPGSEHAGLFYPWVLMPDGAGARPIPPEGYVAACRARAHRDVGPWRAPAGQIAQSRYILGPSVELNRAAGDALDEGRVSAIRRIVNTTRLYGWRSLSPDADNYALLVGRDMLNYLAVQAEALLEPFVFETIDGGGRLLSRVESTLVGLVDPIRADGGLFERLTEDGEQIDPGYSVDVGETVNTDAVLASNTINAVLAVRVSPVGTLIRLTIVKAALTASV
ncbi:hypothetical protein [Jiangella muralis]|uniref:hypothetical protein n=1 Tax=Jiangella muralis TaxID=702383 RepID=UPI00069E8C4F|nr:hypothetical protein [Jiangella muralis]